MTANELHIYKRVSSNIQESDGTSLDTQHEVATELASKLNLKPVYHNEGARSSNHEDIDKRPVFAKLLYEASQGKVSNMWCWEVDRMAREDMPQALLRKTLRDNGILLYIGKNTRPSDLQDPKDELMLTILGAFSKYENSLRSVRSKMGKMQKVRDGYWHGGPPPYGYQLVDKRLEQNPDEVKVVNAMFEQYAKGKTIVNIRDYLFNEGIPTRRNNMVWSGGSIQNVLTENTHYSGYYVVEFDEVDSIRVQCPQIVPNETIKKVNAEHKKRSRTHGGRQRTESKQKVVFLLRDLMLCGHCGKKYGATKRPNKGMSDYYCLHSQSRYRTIDPHLCDAPRNSINIEQTDQVVVDAICDILGKSVMFKEQIKQEVFGESLSHRQTETKIKSTKKRIKERKHQLTMIEGLLVEEDIDKAIGITTTKSTKDRYRQLEERKQQVLDELEQYQTEIEGYHYAKGWVNWVKKHGDQLELMRSTDKTIAEKKAFIEGVVDTIQVSFTDKHTAKIEVNLKYPFVGDALTYNNPKKKSDGYTLREGTKTKAITHAITEAKRGRPSKAKAPPDAGK